MADRHVHMRIRCLFRHITFRDPLSHTLTHSRARVIHVPYVRTLPLQTESHSNAEATSQLQYPKAVNVVIVRHLRRSTPTHSFYMLQYIERPDTTNHTELTSTVLSTRQRPLSGQQYRADLTPELCAEAASAEQTRDNGNLPS